MRDPFPKDLVIDAWNARVGCSFESNRTQAAYGNAVSIWLAQAASKQLI
jgi:hypothetical protein